MGRARAKPESTVPDHDDFAPAGDIGASDTDTGTDGARDEAERPEAEAAPAPSEDRVGKLEAELAELKKLFATASAAGTVAPPGYRLVKDEPDQDARSLAEKQAIIAHIDKGKQKISQEEADRRYPEGKHRFVCLLEDGNGHPELIVSASHEVDAAARYLDVCGVQNSEKKVSVKRA